MQLCAESTRWQNYGFSDQFLLHVSTIIVMLIFLWFSITIKYRTFFLTFFDFIDELRHLLGREVDLVDETAIKNDIFRKELNNTKRLIYG